MTDRPIDGAYEFFEPPADLMGWLPEESERAYELVAGTDADPTIPYSEYLTQVTPSAPSDVPIWELAKQVTGAHLPTWQQQTGDCVSMGCIAAWNYRQIFECAMGQEEVFRLAFPPYVYGISRTARDLGNGRLGSGAGSTGVWGAGAMRRYGMLFVDDDGVPRYSGRLADEWGRRGPPAQMKEIAQDNLTGKTARLERVSEIQHELENHRPVTMACMYDFEMAPREYRGYHVGRRGRTVGGHQGCLIAWMQDPFAAAYWIGSWGPNTHGRPLNDEPPGGFWIRTEDLGAHIGGRSYSEFFAMSLLQGHPGPVDPGIL
jgi:hypothetical protein